MNNLAVSFSHLLTAQKLEVLKNHDIKTSLDFVQTNNDKIAHMIGCNVSEIIKIKEAILSLNNSQATRGDKLYDVTLTTTTLVGTGIAGIDEYFGGGFPTGTIVEVCGHSNSGKTQFALHLSAHASLNQLQTVAYLSTSSINAERVLEFMKILKSGTNEPKNFSGLLEDSLKRISFTYLSDIQQLFEMLWNPDMARFRVVVIDSLASLFLPILGDSFNDAIALLNKVASDLKRLAVENRCLIVIINHASNGPAQMPFLGRYWLHVPNLRLHSKRLSSNEFQLTIVTNVHSPINEVQWIFSLPQSTA